MPDVPPFEPGGVVPGPRRAVVHAGEEIMAPPFKPDLDLIGDLERGQSAAMPDRIVVYKDNRGAWRWRVLAPNGRKIAASGESFTRKWSAKRAAKRAMRRA